MPTCSRCHRRFPHDDCHVCGRPIRNREEDRDDAIEAKAEDRRERMEEEKQASPT